MALTFGTFKFVLTTPTAKLLECRSGSVIVPSHDGQMGILRNHVPMLTKLGLGIMQVKEITYGKGKPGKDKHFLIDGGFVRISENNVTVLAYDAESFDGMDPNDIKPMVQKAKEILAGDKYAKQIRRHDVERASVILQLAKLSGFIKSEY